MTITNKDQVNLGRGTREVQKPENAEVLHALEDMARALLVCPRCESKPGEECMTVPRDWTPELGAAKPKKTKMHSTRVAPLAYAYFLNREA